MRTALALLAVLLAAGCSGGGGGGGNRSQGGGGSELVVGTLADPIVLDGALASDRESTRAVAQIVEGLTALAPGTTRVVPKLAVRWTAVDGGRAWDFELRRGVRFHDGTPFDASAVCFNFERWYGFESSLQNRDATYYWHEVFGGFRTGSEPSLYRGCEVMGSHRVRLLLQRPFGAIPAALALPAFGIASPQALRRYRADEGVVDGVGNFNAGGTYANWHPTGTGPFRFGSWVPGSWLALDRNPDYWGRPARVDRLVFRPLPASRQRVDAVRSGAVDIADLYGRTEVDDSRSDDVRIVVRPPFDVGYVGVNQRHAPLDRRAVREALAHGLDRAAVVRGWYLPGAEVAREFTPPTLAGYAAGVPEYAYAPERSRDLLRRAGVAVPVPIELWYPTVVRRPYLPEPEEIARRFAAGLERAGFDVTLRGAPWLPDYIRAVRTGEAAVYLLGWIGDYADPSAFLNVLFGSGSTQFGFVNPPLTRLLGRAEAEPEPTARAALYRRANRELMQDLPGVPFVTTRQPVGLRRSVRGFRPSPLGIDSYADVTLSPR